MNVKIEKYYPHIYEGHNTESNYRYLGFLPLLCFGYEQIKVHALLTSRFRYPGSGKYRLVPFHPIPLATKKFFEKTVPCYIIFDIIYRNLKYNSNQSKEYKFKYTVDLILFHSVATYLAPYLLIGFFTRSLVSNLSFIVRRRVPLTILSILSYAVIAGLVVKASDIMTDALLDVTYRKYIFDFKKDFTGFRKFVVNEIPEEKMITEYLNKKENIMALNKLDFAL